MTEYKGLSLPKGTKVMTKICLTNEVGVTIKEFDTEEDLLDHLRRIAPYTNKFNESKEEEKTG